MIKDGQYGKYYEWTDNGPVKRLSLSCYVNSKIYYSKTTKRTELDLTEDDCANIVAGKKVTIKLPKKDGFNVVECSLGEYIDKEGNKKPCIKAYIVEELLDDDVVKEALKNKIITPVGNTLATITKNFDEQIKTLGLRNEYSIQFSEQKITQLDIITGYFWLSTPIFGVNTSRLLFANFDAEYNLIEYIDYEKFNALCKQEQVYRDKVAEEEKERKHQEFIEEINSRKWIEMTLANKKGNVEEKFAALIEKLKEKYPDYMNVVLFRYKPYQSYEKPAHYTFQSSGWHSYLIKDVLPEADDFLGMLMASGWVDVSFYHFTFEGDPDVVYKAVIEALPTD